MGTPENCPVSGQFGRGFAPDSVANDSSCSHDDNEYCSMRGGLGVAGWVPRPGRLRLAMQCDSRPCHHALRRGAYGARACAVSSPLLLPLPLPLLLLLSLLLAEQLGRETQVPRSGTWRKAS